MPGPALDFADLGVLEQLQRPGQRRRRCRVTLSEAERERVEQHVHGASRAGSGKHGARRVGGLPQAGRVARPYRRPEGLEVGGPGQGHLPVLIAARRADQEFSRITAATLVESDLSAQMLRFSRLRLVERVGVGDGEQPERGVELTGVAFGPRGREQPS
jgi:hypothetical protein